MAFVATIMLVIAGGPGAAQASACDPCPPDCPMMMAAGATGAAAMVDHGKAPVQGDKPAKAPCAQAGLCQAPVAPPMTAAAAGVAYVPVAIAKLALVSDRAAPSRPPDPALRPPIRI